MHRARPRLARLERPLLAAWDVPSRNRGAVVLIHGSSGNRARVADRAELLARHGYGTEIPVTRLYAQAAGTTAQVWEIPEAGHTGGLRARPAEYERRVIGFLDEALGLGRRGGRDV